MNTQDFEQLKSVCEKEVWTDIKGYEGLYQVSNFGHTFKLKTKMARAELKPVFDFCEQNGFEINSNDPFQLTFTIKKKDVWDDVEFYQTSAGKIKKMDKDALFFIKANCGAIAYPSTESAYVEQLKKEALERFGEIKSVDKFDTEIGKSFHCSPNCEKWSYNKIEDILFAYGVRIYQSGKWATRVKERVEVVFADYSWEHEIGRKEVVTVKFFCPPFKDVFETGKFLAKQLEEYLNR